MNYEEVKAKHPDWNWAEAEEVSSDDLEAAAEMFDKLKSGEMKPLPPELKKELEHKKLCQKIHERITFANAGHIFREKPVKTDFVLPEEFSGRDLKRAKKLMKGRKK
jgi:hypothetical protein